MEFVDGLELFDAIREIGSFFYYIIYSYIIRITSNYWNTILCWLNNSCNRISSPKKDHLSWFKTRKPYGWFKGLSKINWYGHSKNTQ